MELVTREQTVLRAKQQKEAEGFARQRAIADSMAAEAAAVKAAADAAAAKAALEKAAAEEAVSELPSQFCFAHIPSTCLSLCSFDAGLSWICSCLKLPRSRPGRNVCCGKSLPHAPVKPSQRSTHG
jgi:hypothetical protein